MIIDCISDLHGHYPQLEGGDLLIVAGDLTAKDSFKEYQEFGDWIAQQNEKYKYSVVIAGNHDNRLYKHTKINDWVANYGICYLEDSGTEFVYWEDEYQSIPGMLSVEIKKPIRKSVKIWGSPWTKTFEGMNPHAKAFTVDTEEKLAEKWALIPDDIDILITHSPPWGILDKTSDGRNVGSISLHKHGSQRIRPILSIFGHIHEAYGKTGMINIMEGIDYKFVNASHVNEYYQPVNKPIRVIL